MTFKIFPGKYSSLEGISEFVTAEMKPIGFDENEVYSVQLAVDEACTNVIEHSYGGENIGEIEIDTNLVKNGFEIIIRDYGKKFDPSKVPGINSKKPLKEVESRGAGLFLMKKLMDDVSFHFTKNKGTTLRMLKIKAES
ncbi:MAG: ATP-binding protein [Chloroflexi bacterium]|jgi:serine/threonine-protein kinase RsbW|nr:ATP-binding protein [Chloroflexota bacterium]MBT4003352.1 ATP-binding protein [Chloroflexota bacterium]MBT4305884.1 ATP-binding protein [Chloroflexota bacterium]MBT4533709.1 ATP-binding protein [Chloroflexota bacterium]MBT4681648.1 ATP-binding protein [Chloroflexota bacterium]